VEVFWIWFWLILVGLLFAVIGVACVISVVFGLPGSWLLILMALLIEVADTLYLPEGERQTFHWWVLIVCIVLAGIGELLEFFAGMLGAKTAGSSKYGVWGALIGGLGGAILGLFIPLIGSLVGALLGTFLGAIAGELIWQKRSLQDSVVPATGATIGRILGSLSKVPIAFAIWLLLVVSVFWP
jgi:uncharacterized protein YqgC (DUF456 family)